MEPNISNHYFSYKSNPKAFKRFLNFLPNGPHKSTFVIFEILTIFWDPMGAKMAKRYSPYKSQAKVSNF